MKNENVLRGRCGGKERKEEMEGGGEGEDSTWTTMNEMTASTGGRTPGQAVEDEGGRGAFH